MTLLFKQHLADGKKTNTLFGIITEDVQSVQQTPSRSLEHVVVERVDRLMRTVADMAGLMSEEAQVTLTATMGYVPDSDPPAAAPVIENKVVVVISGGTLQAVHTSRINIKVEVIDCDDLQSENKSDKEIEAIVSEATKDCPYLQS